MSLDNNMDKLRKKAATLFSKMPKINDEMDRQDIQKLFEELHIHQIEIEIQNEELIRIQKDLEINRHKYVQLFEQAPISYVLLDPVGIIKQFNSAFMKLIDGMVLKQSGQAFADLLEKSDADAFRARYKAFFKSPQGKQIEARLKFKKHQFLDVLIEACRQEAGLNTDHTRPTEELLVTITDITDLQHAKRQSQKALKAMQKRESEISSLLEAARLIIEQDSFPKTALSIMEICSRVVESTFGYITLRTEDGKEERVLFPEFDDVSNGKYKKLQKQIASLEQEMFQSIQADYVNHLPRSGNENSLPSGQICPRNALFAPLVVNNEAVGMMSFINKRSDFTDTDIRIAEGFSELVAIAFRNARLKDRRETAEKEKVKLINELTEALANVKKLSGLLPICSHCKKIRDDKGYWNQVDVYIQENSEADLSHGICPDCIKKYYSDMDSHEE